YEEAVSNDDGDFAALAEEVMGDQNDIPDGLS
ncbi:MAG TPA: division/cell wall cluster transcriptional repressor MraZ, partial [Leeuwenhoekiella sp.]|nr:division/cell wall cluster transcriptional repressor MraZ [Leeuwenhoekiella sp.]